MRALQGLENDVSRALSRFNTTFPASAKEVAGALRIRNQFSYNPVGAPPGTSDRKAPPRQHRPPAGKIGSSRGITLQLLLVLIAARQVSTKAKTDALTVAGNTEQPTGWRDLVATGAVDAGKDNTLILRSEKRLVSVRSALTVLAREDLVWIDRKQRSSEQTITLFEEVPPGPTVNTERYQIPRDGYFTLPWSFIRQGWVFFLRDSEIQLLMMLACGIKKLPGGIGQVQSGEIAVPGEDRLLHYGIHRDPFSRAAANLQHFGLLEVRESERHTSGRGVDSITHLHRFRVLHDAFDRPAFESARDGLQSFLS